MARTRYIGEHLIARAFERTFHRDHWDDKHGLSSQQVAILAGNPQFDVDPIDGSASARTDAASAGVSGNDQ